MNIKIDNKLHEIEKAETITRQEPKTMTGGHLGANVVAFAATMETTTITTEGEVFVIADVVERPRGTARMIPNAIRMTAPYPADEPPMVNAVATFADGQEVAVLFTRHPRPPEAADAVLGEVRAVRAMIPPLVAEAERERADTLREAIRVYRAMEPDKAACLAAYMDTGTVRGAVKKTGFAQGKVSNLLNEIEVEQKVNIINRRKPGGEHAGDHYKHDGQLRDRTHRAK